MSSNKGYDNHGNLSYETNTCIVDGKVITTSTSYTNYGGEPKVAFQNIGVHDHNTGKVSSKTVIGGKLLP
jgi:hypothetical protein